MKRRAKDPSDWKLKFVKPADIILLIFAAAAVALFLFYTLRPGSVEALSAVVSVDGEKVAVLPLNEDADYSPADGIVIRVRGGEAYFAVSDCPDQLCIKAGQLKKPGDTAVCLPRRVTVRITGGQAARPDAVTH